MRIRRRFLILALVLLALLAAAVTSGVFGPEAVNRFAWGASSTERSDRGAIQSVEDLERLLGQRVRALRMYSRWDDPFPAADHVALRNSGHQIVLSIKPLRQDGTIIPWADIADAPEGSLLEADMVRWAEQMREFSAPIVVIFHHEPETKINRDYGIPADFKRAWRRLVEVFRAHQAINARFLWTMTDAAFSAPADDRRAVSRWYPGDDVVDAIGADVYNWYDCRDTTTEWQSFAQLAEPLRQFGLLHPDKPLWIPEFGTVEDSSQPGRKAQWFTDATTVLGTAEWSQFEGALYFHHVDTVYPDCQWWVDTSPAAIQAFAAMGRAALGSSAKHPPATTGG